MSTDSLEQRLYDLLQPYREECYKNAPKTAPAIEEERLLLILCENISFIIRHNQSSYGKIIVPIDISIGSRNWSTMIKGGGGIAGMGIFVNGNGYTHTVMRCWARKEDGKSVIEILTEECDRALANFFPEVKVEPH